MNDFFGKKLYINDIVLVKYNSPIEPFLIGKVRMLCSKRGDETKTIVIDICKNVDDLNNNDENIKTTKFRDYPYNCIKINIADAIDKFSNK